MRCSFLQDNRLAQLPSGLLAGCISLQMLFALLHSPPHVHNDMCSDVSFNALTSLPEGLFSDTSRIFNMSAIVTQLHALITAAGSTTTS